MQQNTSPAVHFSRKTTILFILAVICTIGFLFFPSYAQDTLAVPEGVHQEAQPADTLDAETEDPVTEQADEPEDEPVARDTFERGNYSRHDLRRGQRLFGGMVAFGSGTHDCSSCHYTSVPDTMNWNPSARDLALVWQENPGYSISQLLANPVGRRMIADHADMIITREEEHQLEAYFEYLLEQDPGRIHPFPVNAFIFWGFGILMALALLDLIVTRKIRFRALHALIILAGLMVHLRYAMTEAQALGRTAGYAPDQPIKFSHRIHAGENQIDCSYCHHVSSFSLSAGIPSNNTCLNCHNVVREGTHSGRFEINKIHRSAESGQPVEWVRIHRLPDHSKFSHSQHVNAGQQQCSDCHGEVEQMHILRQEAPLSMGWCLTCHRDTQVNFLANPYFEMYEQLHRDLREGRIDYVTAARLGGEDCYVCHH